MENSSICENNIRRKWGWKKITLFPFFIAAGIFVFGTIVMYLWNEVLIDVISGIHAITFWQAIGITILCKILFGGFHPGHGGHRYHNRKREIHDHWMKMNPEEKEKMKKEWLERFDHHFRHE